MMRGNWYAQGRTTLLTRLNIMGKAAFSSCAEFSGFFTESSCHFAHRVAPPQRTGLRSSTAHARVIVTQEFANIGFVPMAKGLCSVVNIRNRCEGQSRVTCGLVVARICTTRQWQTCGSGDIQSLFSIGMTSRHSERCHQE